MLGLRRYAVNRGTVKQPYFADSAEPPGRIAELWWDDVAAVERCFSSPSGLADLGDTSVWLPDKPVNFPSLKAGPVTFLEETSLRVARPLGFDLFTGRYIASGHGVKLFGFLDPESQRDFDDWYETEGQESAFALPNVGSHILERQVQQEVHIGNIVWGRNQAASRVVSLYFANLNALNECFASSAGKSFLSVVEDHGPVRWVAMRNQEIFFSFDLDESIYGPREA